MQQDTSSWSNHEWRIFSLALPYTISHHPAGPSHPHPPPPVYPPSEHRLTDLTCSCHVFTCPYRLKSHKWNLHRQQCAQNEKRTKCCGNRKDQSSLYTVGLANIYIFNNCDQIWKSFSLSNRLPHPYPPPFPTTVPLMGTSYTIIVVMVENVIQDCSVIYTKLKKKHFD